MTTQTTLRRKCRRCGHAYSFHGKNTETVCKAMGCKAGPDGVPCQGYLGVAERKKSLSAKT